MNIDERAEVMGCMPQQVLFEPGVFLEGICSSDEDEVSRVGRHPDGAWSNSLTPASQIVGADDDPFEEMLLATGGPSSRHQ